MGRALVPETSRLAQLQRLWTEHVHQPVPAADADPRVQEVVLYATWVGSMVEVALSRGSLDANRSLMLKTRRAEGNQPLFRAGAELGEPLRSYLARVIAMEDLLAALPVA
jgi:hypothetical protein